MWWNSRIVIIITDFENHFIGWFLQIRTIQFLNSTPNNILSLSHQSPIFRHFLRKNLNLQRNIRNRQTFRKTDSNRKSLSINRHLIGRALNLQHAFLIFDYHIQCRNLWIVVHLIMGKIESINACLSYLFCSYSDRGFT